MIIKWDILRAILAIGISAFAMTAAGSLAVTFVNRALVTLGGDIAVSTYGLIHRIMMFALMPGMVIGQGMQPILGFNYGAKRYDRALKVIKIAAIATTTCSTIAFFALYFGPELFLRIFTTDNELIVLGAHAAKRIFFVKYLVGITMVGSTVFQATGKAPQAFVTAIARPALFLLPLVFIFSNYWQLDGVWLAFPITDALTFILVLILLIPQIKMFRRME